MGVAGPDHGPEFFKKAGEATSLKKVANNRSHVHAAPLVAIHLYIITVKVHFLYPSIDQASAVPPMPVTHVANTVWEREDEEEATEGEFIRSFCSERLGFIRINAFRHR